MAGDVERALGSLYEFRFLVGAVSMAAAAAIAFVAYRRGWHLVARRYPVAAAAVGVPVAIVGLALGWWMASPLFTNVTVEEEFPYAYSATVPEGMERADVEQALAGMAMVDDPALAESMPGAPAIDAGAMMAAGKSIPTVGNEDLEELLEAFTAAMESADPEEMQQLAGMMGPLMEAQSDAQGEARAVKRGQFRDADSFHRGSGDAIVYATPGGNHLLRLEDLNVTNGPALHVLLVAHADPADADDVRQGGYVDLGPLKGNRGSQNYPVPSDVDVAGYNSVVVYCKPFSVVFSVAALSAP